MKSFFASTEVKSLASLITGPEWKKTVSQRKTHSGPWRSTKPTTEKKSLCRVLIPL